MANLFAEFNHIMRQSQRIKELEAENERCRKAYARRNAEVKALKELHAEELARINRRLQLYKNIIKGIARRKREMSS